MSHEQGFLRQLHDNPLDEGIRLVYADWLDEQSDPCGHSSA